MNTEDMRELSADELTARDMELREELFNLRFQHATRQLETPPACPR